MKLFSKLWFWLHCRVGPHEWVHVTLLTPLAIMGENDPDTMMLCTFCGRRMALGLIRTK